MNTTFRHHNAIIGNVRQQVKGGLQAGFKGMQIAVVNTHQGIAQRQRALQLFAVMHFNQHVHAKLFGSGIQLCHLLIAEAGRDQQNAVGTDGAGFHYLIGINDKILADHRQIAGGSGSG